MSPGDSPSRKQKSKTVRRKVTILNSRGLHARAAAKFAKAAGGFESDIQVVKGDQTVSGLSIMGLMMLAAGPGCRLKIGARGAQADDAVAALADLIESKFAED